MGWKNNFAGLAVYPVCHLFLSIVEVVTMITYFFEGEEIWKKYETFIEKKLKRLFLDGKQNK